MTRGKQYLHREYNQSKEKDSASCCYPPSIVAVAVCDNNHNLLLLVFQQAGVYQILYLDPSGRICECLPVPEGLQLNDTQQSSSHDDLYVMFTSGTSTASKSKSTTLVKAVVRSYRAATHAYQRWFLLLLPSQANQLLLEFSKTNSFLNIDQIIVSSEVCSAVLLEKFLV